MRCGSSAMHREIRAALGVPEQPASASMPGVIDPGDTMQQLAGRRTLPRMTTQHAAVPPRVISMNVGGIRELEWKGRVVTTGIWKHPVPGRVALRGVNFTGDNQAD